MKTKKVSLKLGRLEYVVLYSQLYNVSDSVKHQKLNSRVSELVLNDWFCRKHDQLLENANSRSGKPRSVQLSIIEVKALYEELAPYSSNQIINNIRGYIDRILINHGFNNKLHL